MALSSAMSDSESEVQNEDSATMPSIAGAPAEKANGLGREVTLLSAVMLNVGQMLGSGIFAVPGVILKSVGSLALFFLAWILAPIFAYAGLTLYSELAAMFPNRSGAEVVWLEQAYPRPRFLVPVSFAVCAILLSHSSATAVVFAQYVLHAFDAPITSYNQAALAILVCTCACGMAIISTKWSLRAINALSVCKVLSLGFIVVSGLIVLLGGTRVKDPTSHFQGFFSGGTSNLNSLATAVVKTNMSFFGWHNAFNVVAEVKGQDPVGVVRKAGYISLASLTVLYFLTNIAYVAAVPLQEIRDSGQLVAALFFRHVFGDSAAARILPFMVAASCLGNILAVTVGNARVLREIARQGLLPYPKFFASTKPFGTPLGPVSLQYVITVLVILALPAKDAFNFVLDLSSYPFLIFTSAAIIGVWILRKRRAKAALPPVKYQARNSTIFVYLLWSILLLVLPWVPPESGHSDVSFWYATYCVAGIGILLICGVYYYFWIVLLPKLGGYEVVEEIEESSDGARNARLVRRYKTDQISAEEEQPLLVP